VAAPDYVPVSPVDRPRSYESPDHVPLAWTSDRPGDLVGRQPRSPRFGYQGPDQGYALKIAKTFADKVHLRPGERFRSTTLFRFSTDAASNSG